MHRRVLPWLLLGAFFVAFCVRGEAQGTLPSGRGRILVVKMSGDVTKTVHHTVTKLTVGSAVESSAKVNTGPGSSVVLAFSNGASTRLGENSELVVEEFLQEPFPGLIKPRELAEEPSPSRTKLTLNRGELVADVKGLKRKADGFTVQTPAGAASVRGTVFRIVFRPTRDGRALFQLTTASGLVHYTQPGGSEGKAQNVAAASVSIAAGEEIAFTVDVTENAQGQLVVAGLPAIPGTTTGASTVTLQQVVQAAVEIAAAMEFPGASRELSTSNIQR